MTARDKVIYAAEKCVEQIKLLKITGTKRDTYIAHWSRRFFEVEELKPYRAEFDRVVREAQS